MNDGRPKTAAGEVAGEIGFMVVTLGVIIAVTMLIMALAHVGFFA